MRNKAAELTAAISKQDITLWAAKEDMVLKK
jgi:hypothetical protein